MSRFVHTEALLEVILRSQKIEYALFDEQGMLEFASPGLGEKLARQVSVGEPLEVVFPELTGMFPDLRQTLSRGEDLQIEHIARPDWNDGNGYMSLQFIPWQGGILALVKDTSLTASLEQRLVQQRNELLLLSTKLERMQAHLLDITTRFLPGQLVTFLIEERRSPTIGGECREVTVLFADLRGFTRWSLGKEPGQIFENLNRLLAEVVRIVLAWDGTLDKFMGDGIMVLFNAPHDQPDHVERAARCALELSNLILPESDLRLGIGIHSGKAMVGFVGAAQAMNYTALGETVNLAKRIEESAAGGEILVSGKVASSLQPSFRLTFQRNLPWGGENAVVPLYRLEMPDP
ncbi:MAG: adenylate/guanylate cyclase domain-containing protein [Anaerolineales bacterium]